MRNGVLQATLEGKISETSRLIFRRTLDNLAPSRLMGHFEILQYSEKMRQNILNADRFKGRTKIKQNEIMLNLICILTFASYFLVYILGWIIFILFVTDFSGIALFYVNWPNNTKKKYLKKILTLSSTSNFESKIEIFIEKWDVFKIKNKILNEN